MDEQSWITKLFIHYPKFNLDRLISCRKEVIETWPDLTFALCFMSFRAETIGGLIN